MSQEFNVRIKGKIDTQENFEASQDIFLNGELLTVKMNDGTIKFKVGDGVSNFLQLNYTNKYLEDQLKNIPDFSDFVIAEDISGIEQTIPPSFAGYTIENFLLVQNIVDNLNSTEQNKVLSANQGKILNEKITSNSNNISNLSNQQVDINDQLNILNDDVQSFKTSTSQSINNLNNSIDNKINLNGGNFTGIVKANSNTNYDIGQIRNIFLSTSEPTSANGDNGDIWIVYGG